MAQKTALKRITSHKVTIFKARNRKGYAAVCMNNLTEGDSPGEAFRRLINPLKRMGYELVGKTPKARG